MRKYYLTCLLILLTALITPLIVGCSDTLAKKGLEEPEKPPNNTSEEIDKLTKRLTNLEEGLELMEIKYREAFKKADDKPREEPRQPLNDANKDEDIDKLTTILTNLNERLELLEKKNRETLEKVEDRLIEAKTIHNLGRQALEISENNLSLPRILIALVGAIGGLILAAGWLVFRNLFLDKFNKAEKELASKFDKAVQEIQSQIKQNEEEIDKERKDFEGLFIDTNWATGLQYTFHAVDVYLTNTDEAIDYGEKGLKQLERGKSLQEKLKAEFAIVLAKANLAYYYAYASTKGKSITAELRITALKYVDDGIQMFRRVDHIEGIDSFLFVYKEFGKDRDDQLKWLEIYNIYQEEIKNKIGHEVAGAYLTYYEKIKTIADK